MKCDQAISLIHEYLDGELNEEQMEQLHKHLSSCAACHALMDELSKTESLIKHVPIPAAHPDLTERIMASMPPVEHRKRGSWLLVARRHPAATAAALFLVMMLISVFTLNDHGQEIAIRGSGLDQLEITGDQVTVPEGATIPGDLVVENGALRVDGKVEGDVTVIDGSFHMASTAAISGKVSEINQWIDRLWFAIYDLFTTK